MVEGAKVISQEEVLLGKSKEGGLDTFPVVDSKFDRFLGHTKKCINEILIVPAFENPRDPQHLYGGVGHTSTTSSSCASIFHCFVFDVGDAVTVLAVITDCVIRSTATDE